MRVISACAWFLRGRVFATYARRPVHLMKSVQVVGCAPRLAIKASCAFLDFPGVEAVGAMSAARATSACLMNKNEHFVRVLVTRAKLRVLRVVQVIVPRVFTAEHPSVDALVRGVGDVARRHARKSPAVVTTIRSVFPTKLKRDRAMKIRIVR